MGRRALVRSREAAQIYRVFVQDKDPIRVLEHPANVHVHKILGLELPNSTLFKTLGTSSFRDYCKMTEANSPNYTWALMPFSDMLNMFRKAREACKAEAKPTAALNIEALHRMSEMASEMYTMMKKAGTLGPNDINFECQMYLHVQWASDMRELPVGPGAMSNFREAARQFAPRLPGYVIDLTADSPVAATANPKKTLSKRPKSTTKPRFGCWLCPEVHYVTSKTHPTRPKKLKKEVKAAILKRVADFDCEQSLKDNEVKKIKEYWSRLKL